MKKNRIPVPEQIGRYRIREKIAKGGMSMIYRANDDLIGRDVAIKIVDASDKACNDINKKVVRRQFEQEVRVSGQLSHHNFVTIYDAGEQGDLLFLVMELLNGFTLAQVTSGRKPDFDMKSRLEILIQVGKALHHSHQRGIVHRDIKPSNIMVLPSGHVKVMDFGVAYAVKATDVNLKKEQMSIVGGTPYYMSPEQINNDDLDGKSDLFSLAVVAYELLGGKRPFTGENKYKLYELILGAEPEPLKKLNSDIPDKIADTITTCLSKNPDNRLVSCQAFADQIDQVLNESYFTPSGEMINKHTLAILKKYKRRFTFFLDFTNSQIYKLLQVCETRDFKAGDTIFEKDSVAREMFLVISGAVDIIRQNTESGSMIVFHLKRGDIFGEMGIIDGGPRSASAIAKSDCRVLALHQVSILRSDDKTSAKIYRNLAHIISTNLRATTTKLDDFYSTSNM